MASYRFKPPALGAEITQLDPIISKLLVRQLRRNKELEQAVPNEADTGVPKN